MTSSKTYMGATLSCVSDGEDKRSQYTECDLADQHGRIQSVHEQQSHSYAIVQLSFGNACQPRKMTASLSLDTFTIADTSGTILSQA